MRSRRMTELDKLRAENTTLHLNYHHMLDLRDAAVAENEQLRERIALLTLEGSAKSDGLYAAIDELQERLAQHDTSHENPETHA